MKAYLTTSGAIFGLLALWHIFELISHWRTLASDRWYTVGISTVVVLTGMLCIWAFILIKLLNRRSGTPTGTTLH